jgi:hypothetical protein
MGGYRARFIDTDSEY